MSSDPKIATRMPVTVDCPACGERVSTMDLSWSDFFDDYVCEDCVASVEFEMEPEEE